MSLLTEPYEKYSSDPGYISLWNLTGSRQISVEHSRSRKKETPIYWNFHPGIIVICCYV